MSFEPIKRSALAEYLSLASMTILTVLAVANKSISVFYIIYLFWWDELLKSIFDLLKYWFKKPDIPNPNEYRSSTFGRFFFLAIYIVFIIVFFGFMIDWKKEDMMGLNFEVFLFMNPLFNFSLLGFLLREIYLYRYDDEPLQTHHLLSRGIITLHISIILGILLWAFVTRKMEQFSLYASVVSIIPFLLLKVFFEVQEIKQRHSQKSHY